MNKIALITGITGQDGSYLVELLLEKGYEVHGIVRRTSTNITERIGHVLKNKNLKIHYGDVTDLSNTISLISKIKPNEIYNLAAQSHVQVSFELPVYTAHVDAIGTLNILESIRILDITKEVKFYQASTSELYGKVQEIPQSETTPFYPRSPYGVAKLYGYWIIVNYRESYNIFACNGILFNHESPRRGEMFVTRKITMGIKNIVKGKQNYLELGNLNAKRDWGHAKDYVKAMWLMLQNDKPKDYVIATGRLFSIRDFLEKSFSYVGLDYTKYVKIDKNFYRPSENIPLCGNPSLIKKDLNWQSEITIDELVIEMVENDINLLNERKK